MKAHNYDTKTFEYLFTTTDVKLDPIEQKPLVPANSTLTAPPLVSAHKIPVWNNATSTWQIKDDYRGTIWYDTNGNEHKIDAIGDVPLQSWLQIKPFSLNGAQNVKIQSIKSAYYEALNAPILFNGVLFDADVAARDNIKDTMTAISAGWVLPANFAWIDATNAPHPADVTFIKGLTKAIAERKRQLFFTYQSFKSQVRGLPATATQTDIDAIQVQF